MQLRRISLAVVGALALAATAGIGAAPAGSELVPVYNEPPGGGDITYVTVDYGPIELAPMGSPGWESEGNVAVPRPPGTFGLKSAVFDVVDAEGTPVPKHDLHLHHFVIAKVGAVDPACPPRQYGGINVHPILGTGAERTPIVLPDPYAYRVNESDIWGANYHLMNMSDSAKTVYVRYVIGVQPGATLANTRFVTPWFMDVDHAPGPCGDAVWDVEATGVPGATDTTSYTWTIPNAGVVVGTGSHLHDGGLYGELTDSDGNVICHSPAVYVPGGGHHAARDGMGPGPGMMLDRIEPCPTHYEIDAGEQLTLSAVYDAEHGWDDVMGINLTFIWYGDQSTGAAFFPDAGPSHPFFDPITWGLDWEIVTGFGDGMFHGERKTSRQVIAAMLYRLAGSPPGPFADPGYSDIGTSHPFFDPIAWASAEGVATGYPDGSYRPTACVARNDLVKMLYRLAGSPPGPFADPGFSDVPSGSPYFDAVAWAGEKQMVDGYLDGTFRPGECVTRQVAMAMLYRYAGIFMPGLVFPSP